MYENDSGSRQQLKSNEASYTTYKSIMEPFEKVTLFDRSGLLKNIIP